MPVQVSAPHPDSIHIFKLPVDRYVGLWIAGSFLTASILIALMNPDDIPTRTGHISRFFPLWPSLIASIIAVGMAGPSEVTLDPHSRRYTLISGLPLLASPKHGSLDEIAYLAIRTQRPNGGTSIISARVELEWKDSQKPNVFLKFARLTDAYKLKDTVPARTGIEVKWEVE
jgi:hypothetical protein